MREAAYELMRILARDAETDDEFADQLAEIAADVAVEGDHVFANGMLQLARLHRIGALKLRGTLAATSVQYDGEFHQDATED